MGHLEKWSSKIKMVTMVRLRTLLLSTMIAVSTGGSAEELVEDAGMVDLEESGGQVVVAGGTIVTLVTKAKKCIRKAAPGDNLSVHYTGRLDGPEGKVFDTSRKETPMPFKFQLGANRVIQYWDTRRGFLGCAGVKQGLC